MWEQVRSALGDISSDEAILVAILFIAILGFSWAPRIGGALGSLFDRDEA